MTEIDFGPRIKDYQKNDVDRLVREGEQFKQEIVEHLSKSGKLEEAILPNFYFLAAVYQPPSVSKGGIMKPDSLIDFERGTSKAFLILKMGPHSFDDSKVDPQEPFLFTKGIVNIHDWVCMSPQDAGTMVSIEGVPCRIAYDKRIRMKIPYPGFVW
jgi:hypothetical protein